MAYIIRVKTMYVLQIGLWAKFTAFKDYAKQFDDIASAENAVEDLLNDNFYRNFKREDVTIIPYEV